MQLVLTHSLQDHFPTGVPSLESLGSKGEEERNEKVHWPWKSPPSSHLDGPSRLFLSLQLEWYVLFGLKKKKKINDDGCSYFRTFLSLHLVLIKFYAFVVVVAKVDL